MTPTLTKAELVERLMKMSNKNLLTVADAARDMRHNYNRGSQMTLLAARRIADLLMPEKK